MITQGVGLLSDPDWTHSIYRRARDRPRWGILYMPGLTGTEMSWASDGAIVAGEHTNLIRDVFEACGRRRLYLASVEELIEWGNDDAIDRVDSLYTETIAQKGFKDGAVHLFFASGGAPMALNWALQHPDQVRSCVGVIPAVDAQDIYDHNRTDAVGLPHATYGPQVAYGGSRPPDDHVPARNAAGYAGMTGRLYYSPNDTVIIPSTVTSFCATAGWEAIALPAQAGSGHGAAGLPIEDIANFFLAHS
jgi:pimeloyl-ACP methyl ester carboxylesterase